MIAGLASPLALVPAQAAESVENIEGVIMSRDGDKLVLRGAGLGVTNVTITRSTAIHQLKGPLGLGIVPSSMGPEVLMPGLKVTVEPESAARKDVAKTIRFFTADLDSLYAIQAALAVPQAQINALKQELAAEKDHNSIQDQAIAAGKTADAETNKRISDIGKRIGDLAEYDMKGEVNVLFEVNSTTLSDKAKADLKALADKAKTLRGYLIQVAGYADAQGSASANQALSDRRAVTVARYLQQECAVALSRVLVPIAMGEAKPVASNETAQGRAENRRVTVKLAVNRGIGE